MLMAQVRKSCVLVFVFHAGFTGLGFLRFVGAWFVPLFDYIKAMGYAMKFYAPQIWFSMVQYTLQFRYLKWPQFFPIVIRVFLFFEGVALCCQSSMYEISCITPKSGRTGSNRFCQSPSIKFNII